MYEITYDVLKFKGIDGSSVQSWEIVFVCLVIYNQAKDILKMWLFIAQRFLIISLYLEAAIEKSVLKRNTSLKRCFFNFIDFTDYTNKIECVYNNCQYKKSNS